MMSKFCKTLFYLDFQLGVKDHLRKTWVTNGFDLQSKFDSTPTPKKGLSTSLTDFPYPTPSSLTANTHSLKSVKPQSKPLWRLY